MYALGITTNSQFYFVLRQSLRQIVRSANTVSNGVDMLIPHPRHEDPHSCFSPAGLCGFQMTLLAPHAL